ncbi:transmembrane protein 41B isoform X3 [Pelodiscus sinensis]|uniref:transmembrane protein 41B isoform X3 n=1 Tax=Pelodiscus sinensis TaxID=13735 RepID=UPI003F6A5AB3
MDGDSSAVVTCTECAMFVFLPEERTDFIYTKCKLVDILEEKIRGLESQVSTLCSIREDEDFLNRRQHLTLQAWQAEEPERAVRDQEENWQHVTSRRGKRPARESPNAIECSGLGASFCYMLSYLVGRPVVYRYLTEKAVKWSEQVERHREHLINYIIFLRITPFLPNWFINITSPVINVPLKVFFIGTFLGVAPPSFVAIKAGTTLYQLTTAGEAVSWNSVFVLMILAILSILPAVFQKKLKQKFE